MKTVTSAKFAVDLYELTEDKHKNPEKYRGWSYGLASLDRILGGILRNQFILLGGAQKAGKTTLGLNVAAALGKQRVPFLWVSLEMKLDRMGAALFSNVAGIERKKFRDIAFEKEDWPALQEAVKEVSKWPAFWNYGATTVQSIQELWFMIKEQFEVAPQVVFVDYVQLMDEPEVKNGRAQEVAKISRTLKLWTNSDEEVTVIAMAQLNRESIRKGFSDANAYADSSQLEKDMDVGVILERIKDPATKQYHPNKRRLKVVGAREAAEDEVTVWVDYTKARITDIAPDQAADLNKVVKEYGEQPYKGR